MICLIEIRQNRKRSPLSWLPKGMILIYVEMNRLYKDSYSFHVILFLIIFSEISSTCILSKNPDLCH